MSKHRLPNRTLEPHDKYFLGQIDVTRATTDDLMRLRTVRAMMKTVCEILVNVEPSVGLSRAMVSAVGVHQAVERLIEEMDE